MANWVLLGVLDVNDVLLVSDEVLGLLSEISTGIIKSRVNEFVNKHLNDTNDIMRAAAQRLKTAYERVNNIDEYLSSDEAKDLSSFLATMQYSDVSATTDLGTLKKYREAIIELLAEDEDFLKSYTGEVSESVTRGYKTAYTAKLDEDNFIRVSNAIRDAQADTYEQRLAHERVSTNIAANEALFRNSR